MPTAKKIKHSKSADIGDIPEWKRQMREIVNTTEKLEKYITLSKEQKKEIDALNCRWGTTPHFASLMDKNDPNCPIRLQVLPSKKEQENKYGMDNYLLWKENRATEEKRPDTIARQYKDRVAFTVNDRCAIYCRHCFRNELVIKDDLDFSFDFEEGLEWIRNNKSIRDVLITGGDPFLLSDEKLDYLITELRKINHVEIIRFGTRSPIVLPQRITKELLSILDGYHKVPIWINTQCNHPKELTEETKKAVFDLLKCGINVGNQTVLLKGINDDPETFQTLHKKLIQARIRPYYLFYCEPAPGIDHFRTPIEKGAELIRDTLRGHISGIAIPQYVVATNIGKLPITPNYYFVGQDKDTYTLKNSKGETTVLPQIPA